MRVQIKSIICSTDFSDYSDHAVPYGIAVAKEFGAKLYLCHVIDLSSIAMYGEAILGLEEQQAQITKNAHEKIRQFMAGQDVDWEPLIQIGHAASEISRVAEERGADLVISATHGRSGLKRLILGSVTERLMRTLSCPLLVIHSPERDVKARTVEEIRFQRILIGCDFSPDSNLAFQYGISLAQEFQSELHLVHVIEPPIYRDLLKPVTYPEDALRKDLRTQMYEKLANMVPEEARNWCTPKTILLAGQPNEELTKYAVVNHMDLIVLGVRGHGLVETLFVGSTTDRVVRQAPCPVFSVRPTLKEPNS